VLIDISPSVHSCNYYKVRRFVVKITEEFQVGGANNSHFAMIHCSTYPHLDFHLNDKKFWDPIELEKKIINSVYTRGRTQPFIKRKLFFLFFLLELVFSFFFFWNLSYIEIIIFSKLQVLYLSNIFNPTWAGLF